MIDACYFGDVRDGLRSFAAGGIKAQTCVTSPPYWGLRDYGTAEWEGGSVDCQHRVGRQVQDNKAPGAIQSGVRPGVDASTCRACGARRIDKQIGLEPTMEAYVHTMVEVFRLVRDVLADDGTLWLNLGDSYAGSWGNQGRKEERGTQRPINGAMMQPVFDDRYPSKGSNTGKILDPGIKPKDLCGIPWRVAFALQADGWFLRQDIIWAKQNPMPESVTDRCTKAHEYLFLLSKRERYYFDAAAIAEPADKPIGSNGNFGNKDAAARRVGELTGNMKPGVEYLTKATRNRRSVWTIGTEPFAEAHFATFPTALVEPCIAAGSRVGDVVLDPFMGSGTVAQVAQNLGRRWIGCELNPDYIKLQGRRAAQQGMAFA